MIYTGIEVHARHLFCLDFYPPRVGQTFFAFTRIKGLSDSDFPAGFGIVNITFLFLLNAPNLDIRTSESVLSLRIVFFNHLLVYLIALISFN